MVRPIQINLVNSVASAIVSVAAFVPAYLASLVVRLVMRLLVRLRFGKGAGLVPCADSFGNWEPLSGPSGLICVLFRIRGRVHMEDLRERFREKFVDLKTPEGHWLHPRLRSTFEWFLGYRVTILREEEFDVAHHFTYETKPSNKGLRDHAETPLICESEEGLEDVLERLGNAPVFVGDPQRPPWRFHVFYCRRNNVDDGEDGDGDRDEDELDLDGTGTKRMDTFLFVHLDHVIMDGAALSMAVIPALLDLDASAVNRNPDSMFQATKPMQRSQRVVMHLKTALLAPLTILRLFLDQVPDVNPIRTLSLLRSPEAEENKGRYFICPKTMPLDAFTSIRKRTDAKINSIALFCMYRAMHRFSLKLLESSKDTRGLADDRRWTWTVTCPQSVWVPGDKVELTNRTTGLAYTCTGEEVWPRASSRSELRAALARTVHTVEDPSRFIYAWCMRYYVMSLTFNGLFPRQAINLKATADRFNSHSGIMSNIRGPTSCHSIFGCPLVEMVAFVSMANNWDVGLMLWSYNGKMTVSFTGRKGSFQSRGQLRALATLFEEEVNALHRSLDAA